MSSKEGVRNVWDNSHKDWPSLSSMGKALDTVSPPSASNTLQVSAFEQNDYSKVLEVLLESKGNNYSQAQEFLTKMLDLLHSRMGSSGSDAEVSTDETVSPARFEPFNDYEGDYTDLKPYTLIILVNGSLGVIGHLIGKGGSAISKMEKEANVRIRVEDTKASPVGLVERRVHISGALSNCTYAQQLITERVHAKLKQDGIFQELIKIFIPQEYISHVIGKGGTNIKRIEKESNTRIHIWHEGTAVTDYAIGKVMVIQGSRYNRSKAQYLIARQISSLPVANKGEDNRSGMEEQWPGSPVSQSMPSTSASWSSNPSGLVSQGQAQNGQFVPIGLRGIEAHFPSSSPSSLLQSYANPNAFADSAQHHQESQSQPQQQQQFGLPAIGGQVGDGPQGNLSGFPGFHASHFAPHNHHHHHSEDPHAEHQGMMIHEYLAQEALSEE